MARLAYECNLELRNNISNDATSRPFACTADKYCLYCCCNPQCCLLLHRRPARHLWEAWYFWLGIALLALFLITSVSSYLISSCRHNFHMASVRQNLRNTNSSRRNNGMDNQHEISINIIATPGLLPSHRKMLLIAPQPSFTHMTPIVA